MPTVSKDSVEAKAWNNGQPSPSGGGYGFKISAADRDAFFRQDRGSVALYLGGRAAPVMVNTDKASFWEGNCRELISRDIGSWMLETRAAPWDSGKPPRFRFTARTDYGFDVRRA